MNQLAPGQSVNAKACGVSCITCATTTATVCLNEASWSMDKRTTSLHARTTPFNLPFWEIFFPLSVSFMMTCKCVQLGTEKEIKSTNQRPLWISRQNLGISLEVGALKPGLMGSKTLSGHIIFEAPCRLLPCVGPNGPQVAISMRTRPFPRLPTDWDYIDAYHAVRFKLKQQRLQLEYGELQISIQLHGRSVEMDQKLLRLENVLRWIVQVIGDLDDEGEVTQHVLSMLVITFRLCATISTTSLVVGVPNLKPLVKVAYPSCVPFQAHLTFPRCTKMQVTWK